MHPNPRALAQLALQSLEAQSWLMVCILWIINSIAYRVKRCGEMEDRVSHLAVAPGIFNKAAA